MFLRGEVVSDWVKNEQMVRGVKVRYLYRDEPSATTWAQSDKHSAQAECHNLPLLPGVRVQDPPTTTDILETTGPAWRIQ